MKRALAAALFLAAACRGSQAQDPDDLKKRIEELMRENELIRGELVRAKIEILDLKLREARRVKNFDEETRLLLAEGLESKIAELQEYAFKELQTIPVERRKGAVDPILKKWESASDKFRVLAIPFLAVSGVAKADEQVLASAGDQSPDVRRAVATVLKSVKTDKAFETLKTLLQDGQKEVREAAVDALAEAKNDRAVAPLIELVRKEKEPRILEKAGEAFGIIGSAEAFDILVEMLSNENKSVRWICIKSLGQIGDARAIAELRKYLDATQPPDLREIATRSLGRLKDKESLPVFEQMLTAEQDMPLRDAAADAIGRIGDARSLDALMKAHETEKDSVPKATIWKSTLRIAETDLANLDKVATWLISRGLTDEVEEVAAKVSNWAGVNGAAQIAAIFEKIADFTFSKQLWKATKEHYGKLLKFQPTNWKAHKNLVTTYLNLGDSLNAFTKANEAADLVGADKDKEKWWEFKVLAVDALEKIDKPIKTVEETYALVLRADVPDRVKQVRRNATNQIVEILSQDDAAAREEIVKLGKKIIRALAEVLEAEKGVPGVIKAGNAITGTQLDPGTTDPEKLKATARDWRTWWANP